MVSLCVLVKLYQESSEGSSKFIKQAVAKPNKHSFDVMLSAELSVGGRHVATHCFAKYSQMNSQLVTVLVEKVGWRICCEIMQSSFSAIVAVLLFVNLYSVYKEVFPTFSSLVQTYFLSVLLDFVVVCCSYNLSFITLLITSQHSVYLFHSEIFWFNYLIIAKLQHKSIRNTSEISSHHGIQNRRINAHLKEWLV